MHLRHPFTMLISGPSGCGKTRLVDRLVRMSSNICQPAPSKIVCCYEEYDPIYSKMPGVTFIHGLPTNLMEHFDGSEPAWLLLDDMMDVCSKSELVSSIFTRLSHHRNLSVILILQNLFFQGPFARDISLNANYITIFKNPRSRQSIEYLARQIFPPSKARKLAAIYEKATEDPFSYLFLDLKPATPDTHRVLSHCFCEAGPYLYVYPI